MEPINLKQKLTDSIQDAVIKEVNGIDDSVRRLITEHVRSMLGIRMYTRNDIDISLHRYIEGEVKSALDTHLKPRLLSNLRVLLRSKNFKLQLEEIIKKTAIRLADELAESARKKIDKKLDEYVDEHFQDEVQKLLEDIKPDKNQNRDLQDPSAFEGPLGQFLMDIAIKHLTTYT